MLKQRLLVSAMAAALAISTSLVADDDNISAFSFDPIDSSADSADWDPVTPWVIPDGFTQSVVPTKRTSTSMMVVVMIGMT